MQRGALTVEDFLGRMTKPSVTVEAAPAADAQQFTKHASRALTLAEARVQAQPRDPDSHYQLGATVAVMTSYQAIVEGKALGAFRTAKRAYQSHEEVLRLDPARKDAGLVAGSYRYVVANLSMPMRMLAYVAGFGGGKERGLRLIEEAASYPSDAQPEAQFLLILLYNRELQYDKALQLIGRLQKTYPRNRFLWLNATGTALRAGRSADAERAIEDGLSRLAADRRPRAVGEEALWQYMRGAVRVARRQPAAAAASLQQAMAASPRSWVKGRIHLELGKLADLANDRSNARLEYQITRSGCAWKPTIASGRPRRRSGRTLRTAERRSPGWDVTHGCEDVGLGCRGARQRDDRRLLRAGRHGCVRGFTQHAHRAGQRGQRHRAVRTGARRPAEQDAAARVRWSHGAAHRTARGGRERQAGGAGDTGVRRCTSWCGIRKIATSWSSACPSGCSACRARWMSDRTTASISSS